MTPETLYREYLAACDLATREVQALRPLPDRLDPRPWMSIESVQRFADTNLARLECPSKLERAAAVGRLEALLNILNNTHTY